MINPEVPGCMSRSGDASRPGGKKLKKAIGRGGARSSSKKKLVDREGLLDGTPEDE